jgi:hypothetical protein
MCVPAPAQSSSASSISGDADADAQLGLQTSASSSTSASAYRLTSAGEVFYRYEPGFPYGLAVSSVNLLGGLDFGTYAAPASDGLTTLGEVNARYNLPFPFIDRKIYWTISPPEGTPIIGPRPVGGGTGNEVWFPFGAPPGSVKGPPQPTPPGR